MNDTSKRCTFFIMFIFFLILLGCTGIGQAEKSAGPAVNRSEIQNQNVFSFLATGDSRTEVYLTGGPNQEQEMKELFDKTYGMQGLSRDFKFTYDPDTGALTRIEGRGSVLVYKEGWPVYYRITQGSEVIGIMHDTGRKWVWNRIAAEINRGASGKGALFLVHGGDFIVDGSMGKTLDENPYWQLIQDEILSRLPPPSKALGLPGRVFGVIGNHETYRDEMASGFFSTLPWLSELGMRPDHRIYSFSFRNCLFIFLDCGPSSAAEWKSEYPDFQTQMNYLTDKLKKARKNKTDHVFVTYHKPTYIKVGHNPLPPDQSPHRVLKKFAGDLGIYVFNSHSHTTEQYLVDGVNYFVLGGGGATQNFGPSKKPSTEDELYWKNQPRVEEYNFLEVKVNGANIEGLLHRFRPGETGNPFSVVKMFSR